MKFVKHGNAADIDLKARMRKESSTPFDSPSQFPFLVIGFFGGWSISNSRGNIDFHAASVSFEGGLENVLL